MGRKRLLTVLFCAFSMLWGIRAETTTESGPIFLQISDPVTGYHGLVRENETVVEITPRIQAGGRPVCDFQIKTGRSYNDVPFLVIISDLGTGTGEIRAKRTLNCEQQKNYKFKVVAEACDGTISQPVPVHITILDVNEFSPQFDMESYDVQVDEGQVLKNIVSLSAKDSDCSAKFGDICKYEILNSEEPFKIDENGVISNTEPLNYERAHNHILSVVAYDCAMRRSSPVPVNVRVNRVCHVGWQDVPKRVSYFPVSRSVALFPEAALSLCEADCEAQEVGTTISLQTEHVGKGCDRDTYSVENQRKLCGADASAIDLLPSPVRGNEWTASLVRDEGFAADEVFAFNGVTDAVSLPAGVLPDSLPSPFSLSFWMRHGTNPERTHKEHVLCAADDREKNRHHLAVFVRNCHLIILIRKDFSDGDLNNYSPAEWRWKLEETCDNSWHHFSLAVTYPDIKLYLDGVEVTEPRGHTEVIDDWPLHPTADINVKWTIGACWQGSENRMQHMFKGDLAGLSYLPGKTENPDVLACLQRCQESLVAPDTRNLKMGTRVTASKGLNQLSLHGSSLQEVQDMLRQVGYKNSRRYPSEGRRPLKLKTSIACVKGHQISVPDVDSYIDVPRSRTPIITIKGQPAPSFSFEDFRMGISMFPELTITVSEEGANELNGANEENWKNGEPASSISHTLDSCRIQVSPPLDPDFETVVLPDDLLASLGNGLRSELAADHIAVAGVEKVYSYEQVLRQIKYFNKEPSLYVDRKFVLVCSEMNRRFVSNEYTQTLKVKHPTPKPEPLPPADLPQASAQAQQMPEIQVAHAQIDRSHHAELSPPKLYVGKRTNTSALAGAAGHTVTVIIVVCVGFLLFIVVLGVIRVKSTHRRGGVHEAIADTEMAWDDSALNITVNPMENVGQSERSRLHDSDSESSDSNDDSNEEMDEDESSGDEAEGVTVYGEKSHDGYEWDSNI